ncbi:family 43 glycosylhydrolase [Sphingobacterium sp. DN00404]|uniref:Family 43 glycosylhydrolase n=1 Tax=Sphingobacterium micropteri TaxID=2763501 RepID=A0ABR7YTS7_9SPHI|nr:family 43 glycosylhydrolase [Sphingobacterium micropteri]MBD1434682.1 family 43 glycosylhydrolase [Sphingobacterium micropteri]
MKQIKTTFLLLSLLLSGIQLSAQGGNILEKDLGGYLFTYFGGGENGEAVRFAISLDGYNYFSLNDNQPVLDSKQISSAGGLRDPHILRAEDGKTFYMVATDMMASKGWDSNRAMVLLKSTDLINWNSSIVNIQQKYSGQEDLKRVWAPQTIYDKEADKYMIYWSMKHGDGPDIIYYAYANTDFTDLETEPKQLFFPKEGKPCIDGDIIHYEDSLYYMFYKTEGHGDGIKLATTASLTSGKWDEKEGYKQQTQESVEGSSIFKLNNSDTYILMYDVYRKKEFHFTKSDDLKNFTPIDQEISMDFKPRHGSIVSITNEELRRLIGKWGQPANLPKINKNPIITGYYADPEIIYSQKDKKYYLYPTSDGFMEWSGHYFKTFSSENLVDWKDEGVILDLAKDVPWAREKAWAPCIIEKEKNGVYKYYYYYTGAGKIGVAVSDEPTGPFIDSGKPLVDWKPEDINRGAEIDPDIFHDPVSGKDYLYWGNGYVAVVELNDNMVSMKKETLQTFSLPRFREAVEVFYRNGIYYFLYSENDTRSEDYRVRYAMSKSPTGPMEIPEDNLILAKVSKKGIYGTGHNSVLQVPGTDEWHIVYHRFSRPNGIDMGRAAGYHREVCIDRLEFNDDGTIKKVVPTL